MEKVLVSACLLGINCRYDGYHCERPEIKAMIKQYEMVPFCPEVFGGLSTPRKKSGIMDICSQTPATGKDVWKKTARVVSEEGEDVTECFIKGAQEGLKTAKMFGIRKAFLKARSPSCGINSVSCFGEEIPGAGVWAELLKQHGIEVVEKK